VVASFGPGFPRFSPSLARSASISRLRSFDMSLTTLLSSHLSCCSPAAYSVCKLPLSLCGLETVPPGRHLSSTRLLHRSCVPSRLSSVRFPHPRLDDFTCPVGQSVFFLPHSRPASFGLHATPEFIAIQSVLVAYLANPRIPTFAASSGGHLRSL